MLGIVIQPDLLCDHGDGQGNREILHKVTAALFRHLGDQFDRLLAHVGFDRVHARGRECEIHQLAVAGMDRVIGGQQRRRVVPPFRKNRINLIIGGAHQRRKIIGVDFRFGGYF